MKLFIYIGMLSVLLMSCEKKYKCVCKKNGFRVYEEDFSQYEPERAKKYCAMLNEEYEEVLGFGKCKLKYTNF